MGCRLTGRTLVFEAICRGSNPRIPVLHLKLSWQSTRLITARSKVRVLPGASNLWGVGVDGEHARLSIERWPVRVRYALLKLMGSWASWSGRSPVKAEITGSSPVGPVWDLKMDR